MKTDDPPSLMAYLASVLAFLTATVWAGAALIPGVLTAVYLVPFSMFLIGAVTSTHPDDGRRALVVCGFFLLAALVPAGPALWCVGMASGCVALGQAALRWFKLAALTSLITLGLVSSGFAAWVAALALFLGMSAL